MKRSIQKSFITFLSAALISLGSLNASADSYLQMMEFYDQQEGQKVRECQLNPEEHSDCYKYIEAQNAADADAKALGGIAVVAALLYFIGSLQKSSSKN